MTELGALGDILKTLKAAPSDGEAWRAFYRALRPFVVAVLFRRLRGLDRTVIEDATQEVFIRVLNSRPFEFIDDVDGFRAYVWRIADNVALTTLHAWRRRNDRELDIDIVANHLEAPDGQEADQRIAIEQVTELAARLLEPRDFHLLKLMLNGNSISEIAANTKRSYSNVAVRLHRIRNELRDRLEGNPKKSGAGL